MTGIQDDVKTYIKNSTIEILQNLTQSALFRKSTARYDSNFFSSSVRLHGPTTDMLLVFQCCSTWAADTNPIVGAPNCTDWVCEVLNILAGNIKSALVQRGYNINLGIPMTMHNKAIAELSDTYELIYSVSGTYALDLGIDCKLFISINTDNPVDSSLVLGKFGEMFIFN